MSMARELIGVWRLVSYTEEQNGREDGHPLGATPEGYLIYTADGFVSAQLMKPGRSLLQSRDWQGGTPEEDQEAGSGYIAYCGAYEVDEEKGTVTHIPSVALLPNLIHQRQLRLASFSGERLTLRVVSARSEDEVIVTSRLEWQRTSGIPRKTNDKQYCGKE